MAQRRTRATQPTVLVTGAGGYVGTTLSEHLLQSGYKVIGFDRYYFGQEPIAELSGHPNFRLIRKDIRDCEAADFDGEGVVRTYRELA